MIGEILTIILSFLFFLFGILALSFFDPQNKLNFWEKFFSGWFLGEILGGYLVLFLSLFLKNLFWGTVSGAFLISILIFLKRKKIFSFLKKVPLNFSFFFKKNKKNPSFLFLLFTIFLFYFFSLFSLLQKDKNGNLVSYFHGWGDTAWHLTSMNVFSEREKFSLENPILKDDHLKYHFFPDFLSSISKKLGASSLFSFHFFQIQISFLTLILLFLFLRKFLSKKFAFLALLFLLFGANLGGVEFLYQLIKNPKVFENSLFEWSCILKNVCFFYEGTKIIKDHLFWRAPLLNELCWTRSTPFGVGFFVLFLILYLNYFSKKELLRLSFLFPLGFFLHLHGILILSLALLFCFFFEKNKKIYFKFLINCFILSLPLLIYFSDIHYKSFQKIHFFYIKPPEVNPLWFFFLNFGFIFIFWLFGGLIFWKKNSFLKFFSLSLVLFLFPNIYQTQPWIWDNHKLFFYWWIFAVLFGTLFLEKFFKGKLKYIFLGIIFFSLISGVADVSERALFFKDHLYGYESQNPVKKEIGDFIKKNLPKDIYILGAPSASSIITTYAGRGLYLGYRGWLWSWGLDFSEKEKNAREILQGNLKIACKEKVKYILLEPSLEKEFGIKIKKEKILKKSKILFQKDSFYLLEIICP